MMQRHLATEPTSGFQALLAFPNKAARPILQRVGYKPLVGALGWVKPLRVNDKLYKSCTRAGWRTSPRHRSTWRYGLVTSGGRGV